MIEEMNNIPKEDDGSLAFLNIPRDENSRSFNCDETTQSKLVNTTFWGVDFIEEVPTRFSKAKGVKGQTLVKIKPSKEQLREAFKEIRKMIEDELKLKIKGNYQIFPIAANRYDKHGRALDYVGYKFYRNQKLIRKSIKKNFCHTVSRLNRRTPLLDAKAYKQAVAPWLGWAKHSDSKHLLKTIIKPCYYDSIL